MPSGRTNSLVGSVVSGVTVADGLAEVESVDETDGAGDVVAVASVESSVEQAAKPNTATTAIAAREIVRT
jgi:hypothetical protein